MNKKITSLVLAGLITVSIYAPSYANNTTQENTTNNVKVQQLTLNLSDIKGHWAETQIQEFVNAGYISGYEDGTFKPNKEITRAEFVKLVNKVFDYDLINVNPTLEYKDVKTGQWFYKDILIANDRHYIKGYEDNTFRPNNSMKREESATIISNIEHMKDDNIDKIPNYKDSQNVSNWSESYVEYCLEREFIGGDENNNIDPKGNMTRAEAVVILDRVKNGGKKLSATEPRGDIAFEAISKMEGTEVSHEETTEGNYDSVRFKDTYTFFNNYSGKYMYFEGVDTQLFFDSSGDKGVKESLEQMIGDKEEANRFWDAVNKNYSRHIRFTQGIFAGRKVDLRETKLGTADLRVYMPEK